MKVIISNTYKTHREQFQIVDATDEIAKTMIDRFFNQFDTPQKPEPEKEVTINPQVIIEPAKVMQAVKAPVLQEKVKKYAEVVRVKDDVNLYVAVVNCGVCGGREHTRLTSTNNTYVKCSHCQQKLIVDQTMPELLLADKRGYAFKASDPYLNDYDVYKAEYEMTQGASE